MSIFEQCRQICREAADRFPASVDKAAKSAEDKIRALPDFTSLVNDLVSLRIRDMVNDARHETNVTQKRKLDAWHTVQKVNPGKSKSVLEVETSIYDYKIAGTCIGDLKGSDIEPLIFEQDGHIRERTMLKVWLSKLRPHVPSESKVRNSVSAKKVLRFYQEAREACDPEQAVELVELVG